MEEINALGAEVAAVSVDPPARNRKVVTAQGFEFPLLSDSDGKAIDLFGIRHEGGSMTGADIARPAVFILDREGRIVWRQLTENWRIRARPEAVIEQLREIP